MKESNEDLKKMVEKMPRHEPPDTIWESIEAKQVLQNQLHHLPTYTPDDMIWTQIDQRLKESNRIVWKRRLAIAATLLLLIMATIGINNNYKNNVELVVTEEKINSRLLTTDWEVSNDMTQELQELCLINTIGCSSVFFKELKKELSELEAAKSELDQAMKLVGKDAYLITQITNIERERSAVIQQMVTHVL